MRISTESSCLRELNYEFSMSLVEGCLTIVSLPNIQTVGRP